MWAITPVLTLGLRDLVIVTINPPLIRKFCNGVSCGDSATRLYETDSGLSRHCATAHAHYYLSCGRYVPLSDEALRRHREKVRSGAPPSRKPKGRLDGPLHPSLGPDARDSASRESEPRRSRGESRSRSLSKSPRRRPNPPESPPSDGAPLRRVRRLESAVLNDRSGLIGSLLASVPASQLSERSLSRA